MLLGVWACNKLKQRKKTVVFTHLHRNGDQQAWYKGVLFASRQHLASSLMEVPAHEMTLTIAEYIIEKNL